MRADRDHDTAVARLTDEFAATVVDTYTITRFAEVSPTSLRVKPGTTWDEWVELGSNIFQLRTTAQWLTGDWYLAGEDMFGEDAAQAVPLGYASETVRKCAWVCQNIPPEERRPELSFTHHARVAALDGVVRTTLLDRAAQHHWSDERLREVVKAARGDATRPVEPVERDPATLDEKPPDSADGAQLDLLEAADDYVAIPRRGIGHVIEMIRAGQAQDALSILQTWRDWPTRGRAAPAERPVRNDSAIPEAQTGRRLRP